MYLSRITLHTGQLSPAQLLHLVDRGEYVMHRGCGIFSLAAKKGNFFIVGKNSRARFAFLSSRRNARRKVIRSP